jgi:hypothetical protein
LEFVASIEEGEEDLTLKFDWFKKKLKIKTHDYNKI